MVVTMSRRIAANLYDEIVALRPDWVTDDDTTGKVKVVITGSALTTTRCCSRTSGPRKPGAR